MKTDTTEKGLETLIMRHMTGTDGLASGEAETVAAGHSLRGTPWIRPILTKKSHDPNEPRSKQKRADA